MSLKNDRKHCLVSVTDFTIRQTIAGYLKISYNEVVEKFDDDLIDTIIGTMKYEIKNALYEGRPIYIEQRIIAAAALPEYKKTDACRS